MRASARGAPGGLRGGSVRAQCWQILRATRLGRNFPALPPPRITRYRAAMETAPASGASSTPAKPLAGSLFVFALVYGGMTVLAGVLGNKQVALGPLAVEAGIFAFLMLVVMSSTVAELHGRETANRMVIIGFVPLIVSMALIGFVLALPAADDMDPERLEAFTTVLSQGPRLMGAGILAYGISTLLNVRLFSALRGNSDTPRGGLWLMTRGAVASALSQVVDTLIFITVAFYGGVPDRAAAGRPDARQGGAAA